MTEKRREPGVIVLGGHVQGYGVVKVFGENGIHSVVIDNSKISIAKHSKYCTAFFSCPYDNLIELLSRFERENKYKNWILIPTDDYYVRLLSVNRETLNRHFKVSVDKWEIIELFFNKRLSYPLAEKSGVPIPKTYFPDTYDEINKLGESIKFPCIIKPAVMLNFYRHFKKKVFVCENKDALKENYNSALELLKPEEIIIQEIIPGSSENQYSVGLFYDRNKTYNHIIARRKRQHPTDFGNATTFAETVEIPELLEYSESILNTSGFKGICEVEFKFDERAGKYKFLEVNPRTWKWHLITESAGVPMLMSLYNFFCNGEPIINQNFKQAAWKDIITDLPVIMEMKMKKIYLASKTKNTVNAVLNRSDLMPFIFELFYLPLLIFKR